MPSDEHKVVLRRIFAMIGLALLFGIIYAQSPLYTSNQNQYFLHGMAAAGFGNLKQDWLANTLDPTPVFSQLIRITDQIPLSELIFYAYYIILMGIYLLSVIGIARILFKLQGRVALVILATAIVAVHSAALRFLLSRGIGEEWTFVFEGGVAGQRVLGVVFQPSTFGVLLVLSLYLFLKDRLLLALFAAVVATYFHPTYLLSAGILVSAYIGTIILLDRDIRKATYVGFTALILVSPVLIYVIRSFALSNQAAQEAQAILVQFRIPHHAIVAQWFDITTLVQLSFIFVSLWLVRKTRLFPVLIISTIFALGLSILQMITGSNSLALIFPWRISVILVPLSVVIILAVLVQEISRRNTPFLEKNSKLITILCSLALGSMAFAGLLRFAIEYVEKDRVIEQAMYRFVRDTQSEGEIYLVPIKLQDFRLETGTAIYVDFKSIPYLNDEVIEWHRRIQLATEFYEDDEFNCQLLETLSQEGVSRVLLENNQRTLDCPGAQEIYHDAYYQIYQFNNP